MQRFSLFFYIAQNLNAGSSGGDSGGLLYINSS